MVHELGIPLAEKMSQPKFNAMIQVDDVIDEQEEYDRKQRPNARKNKKTKK